MAVGAAVSFEALQAGNENAAINHLDGARLRLVECKGNSLNVRPDHGSVDGRHNQHGKGPAFKPLLLVHVLVAGEKVVETFALQQRQQRAVFDATPLHADHGVNFMAGQGSGQLRRHVLIAQNLQRCT